jgi:superfamily II DNA or RNA helicase
MFGLPNRNNTNYPLALSNILKTIKSTDTNLQYHQKVIHDFVMGDPENRGKLIFNEPGTGKTITAASIAIETRESRDVVILSAKSLHANFKTDLSKYVQMNDSSVSNAEIKAMLDANFDFVSLNASNMIDQVKKVGKTSEAIEYERSIGQFAETADLNGKLLIIDEAHNLFNSIVSGGTNASKLYDAIMQAIDIKILFLTGTPIVNDPFELSAAFNMCVGYELLPTDYDQFHELFVDKENTNVKNYNKFVNRIYGLTSYYGSWYQTGGVTKSNESIRREHFPDQLPLKVETIPMSMHQYGVYKAARDKEKDISSSFKKNTKVSVRMKKPKSDGSSYRVHSRQACNYTPPDSVRDKKGSIVPEHLTKEMLTNLDIYSPKMKRILEIVKATPNRTHVIYSNFVKGAGIGIFARVLEHNGYTDIMNTSNNGGKKFAIFSGDVSADDRANIVERFSSSKNKHGDDIHVLLLSGAGSEGISLKNSGAVLLLEPGWNYAKIEQPIARVVRYKGHDDLEKKERTVQPYIFLSDYPVEIDRSKTTEPTTDIQLYTSALRSQRIHMRFYAALIESSFDCPVHIQNASTDAKKRIRCVQCAPTDKPLFHKDIDKDILMPNPCSTLSKKEIKVNEIVYQGKKYYYSRDENNLIDLFEYKKSLSAHIPVTPNNINYGPLIDHVGNL